MSSLPTRCPVLRFDMVLPGKSSSEERVGAGPAYAPTVSCWIYLRIGLCPECIPMCFNICSGLCP
eukprot:2682152-Rhodomonas_salina.3